MNASTFDVLSRTMLASALSITHTTAEDVRRRAHVAYLVSTGAHYAEWDACTGQLSVDGELIVTTWTDEPTAAWCMDSALKAHGWIPIARWTTNYDGMSVQVVQGR